MALTPAGRRLTEAHRLAQAQLSARMAIRVRPLWRLVDPEDIAGTVPGWLDAVSEIVRSQHSTSVALADRYYRSFRRLETGSALSSDLDLPPLNLEALQTSLIVTGPVRVERAIRRSEDVQAASRLAGAMSARAAGRHAIQGSRETILRAVGSDRRAIGFARATSGNPCHFCALIAGRGPVFEESSASFAAHDGCACTAEPVFSRDAEWPPGSRRYADIYQEAAQGESDPMLAFRRAYEGRDD